MDIPLLLFCIGMAYVSMLLGYLLGKCNSNTKVGTPSASHNTGSPKLTAACGGCPLQYVCKGPSLFNTMACRGARSQLRAGA